MRPSNLTRKWLDIVGNGQTGETKPFRSRGSIQKALGGKDNWHPFFYGGLSNKEPRFSFERRYGGTALGGGKNYFHKLEKRQRGSFFKAAGQKGGKSLLLGFPTRGFMELALLGGILWVIGGQPIGRGGGKGPGKKRGPGWENFLPKNFSPNLN